MNLSSFILRANTQAAWGLLKGLSETQAGIFIHFIVLIDSAHRSYREPTAPRPSPLICRECTHESSPSHARPCRFPLLTQPLPGKPGRLPPTRPRDRSLFSSDPLQLLSPVLPWTMVWATSESVLSDGREPLHASTRPLPFFWKGVIGPLCRHSHPLCLLPLRPAALWMDAEQHGSQAPEGGAQGQCHGSGALGWAGWHFTAPSREWDRQGHCLYGRAFQAASVNGVIGPAMAAAA